MMHKRRSRKKNKKKIKKESDKRKKKIKMILIIASATIAATVILKGVGDIRKKKASEDNEKKKEEMKKLAKDLQPYLDKDIINTDEFLEAIKIKGDIYKCRSDILANNRIINGKNDNNGLTMDDLRKYNDETNELLKKLRYP
jgi:hypothetical protein